MQVYLHYPYCATLCPYCDFFSTTADEDPPTPRRVLAELDWVRGGSMGASRPSILVAEHPGGWRLVSPLNCSRRSARSGAWTRHARSPLRRTPTTSPRTFSFSSAGVNRLSVGVQSLRDEELRWLGRRHDAAAAVRSVTHARSAGFDNLSLDLSLVCPVRRWKRSMRC